MTARRFTSFGDVATNLPCGRINNAAGRSFFDRITIGLSKLTEPSLLTRTISINLLSAWYRWCLTQYIALAPGAFYWEIASFNNLSAMIVSPISVQSSAVNSLNSLTVLRPPSRNDFDHISAWSPRPLRCETSKTSVSTGVSSE